LPPVAATFTLEGIASLVDKSLLRQETGPSGETRYTTLETIREFASDQLTASGEANEMRARHAAFFVTLAEQADREFFGPREVAWLDRCEAELGNIRAALDWSTSSGGDPALGLRLGAALWWLWLRRVSLREGQAWLERGLASGQEVPAVVRAKALAIAGEIANFQNDYPQALAWLEEALKLYQTLDDPFGLARARYFLGDHRQNRGEVETAIPPLEEALAGFRALDAIAWAGVTLFYLAVSASLLQDYARSHALAEEALRLCRQAGFASGMAMTFGRLGSQAFTEGDFAAAERHFREALALRLELDDRYGMANQLTELAYVAAAAGEEERAARLDGAAAALRQVTGAQIVSVKRAAYDQFVATLRDSLGPDRFDAIWSVDQGRAPEQVVAAAREIISEELAMASTAATPAAPHPSIGLTPRELDVLRLLSKGRSDREIAAALFIGTRTVQTHVSNLFVKLGVNARAEAAAVAVRRGLV
jgi:non-specific serine/threonine protein kinase